MMTIRTWWKNEALSGGVRTKPKTKTKTASFIIKKKQFLTAVGWKTRTGGPTSMSKRHNTGSGQMDSRQSEDGNIKTISRFAWLECWRASVRNMPCRFQALSFADWQTAIHVSNNLPTGKPGSACFVLRSMSSCAINSLFRLWWVFLGLCMV